MDWGAGQGFKPESQGFEADSWICQATEAPGVGWPLTHPHTPNQPQAEASAPDRPFACVSPGSFTAQDSQVLGRKAKAFRQGGTPGTPLLRNFSRESQWEPELCLPAGHQANLDDLGTKHLFLADI